MEFDEQNAVLPEDEYFNVPGTISMIDVVKAADFLIVSPRVTKKVTDTYMAFPKDSARDFCMTDITNVGYMKIDINGNTIWECKNPPDNITLPFWRGLDLYDSGPLAFVTVYLITTPKNKEEPYSLNFSYTPIFSVTETATFYVKLNFLYNLDEGIGEKYLFVSGGSGVPIDMHERLVDLEKQCGEKLVGFSEAEKREFYEQHGDLPIKRYKTGTIKMTTSIRQTDLIDKYLYYVYTNEPETIQADETLKVFVHVSKYIVSTMPPAVDITVTGENRDKFVQYMKEHYPTAEIGNGRQLEAINEEATKRLRREQIVKYKKIWKKIQDSTDHIPEEITKEAFQAMDENSYYKNKFYEYNQLTLDMLHEDYGIRIM